MKGREEGEKMERRREEARKEGKKERKEIRDETFFPLVLGCLPQMSGSSVSSSH